MSSAEVFAELAKKVPAFAGLTYGKVGSQGAPLSEVARQATVAATQA